MKLIETTFNNFRCFTEYQIHYGTETTVFIGKNGTGKSSVLSGIRRGLSFMFARPKNFSKNLAQSNNAKVRSFEQNEANFDYMNRVYNYPIANSFVSSFKSEELNWSMVKKTANGGYFTNFYKDSLQKVLGTYNDNLLEELPVLAVITDSFPHQMVKFGSKAKKTVSQDILPRDLAYYGWDDRTNCIELWLNRFFKISNFERDLNDDIRSVESQIDLWRSRIEEVDKTDILRLKHAQSNFSRLKERLHYLNSDDRSNSFNNERQFIENKLIEFTKVISDFNFINKDFEIFRVAVNRPDKKSYSLEFNFIDGRVITFETLPMGYKRLFSMVIDIAYRSYILNRDIDSNGIVLIDELELHLHPTLQQDVLQRLRRTFPNIQFIVTTHSPLIVSNFKANSTNKIIRLEYEDNKYSNQNVENVFGIDYNTGLTEIMGANYRESEIDKLIDSIVILKKFNKEEQAHEILMKLEELVGKNNSFITDEISQRLVQNRG